MTNLMQFLRDNTHDINNMSKTHELDKTHVKSDITTIDIDNTISIKRIKRVTYNHDKSVIINASTNYQLIVSGVVYASVKQLSTLNRMLSKFGYSGVKF